MTQARTVCRFAAVMVGIATFATPHTLPAQNDSHQAPKILYIVREATKPGRDGGAHEKTEAAFRGALDQYKGQMHYVALTSLTGPPRTLFMSGYASFDAMEQEHKSVGAALAAALDRANLADGEMLSEITEGAFIRRDDLSSNTDVGMGSRVMEVSQYNVKPGHVHEFEELAKMYMKAFHDTPQVHWTAYQMAFGSTQGPTFLVFTASKSMADVDAEFGFDSVLPKQLGEDGMKRMTELESSAIVSESTNLFVFDPKMSRPPDFMVQGDPGFWKPKATAAAAHKSSGASGQ